MFYIKFLVELCHTWQCMLANGSTTCSGEGSVSIRCTL